MNVALTSAARRELNDASDFYRQHSGDVARRFIDEVAHALARVGEHPSIGAASHGRYRRWPRVRFPYDIVYRITPTGVRVLAIAHQRREPGYRRGRR